MRYILVILALLVSTEGAMGTRWHGGRIRIYDHTSANRVAAEQTVAAFNAVMPKNMPPLLYQPMTPMACEDVPMPKRGIVICGATGGRNSHAETIKPFALYRLLMQEDFLAATPAARRHWMCHELMHAVTGMPDNYDAAPDTSCVWGYLAEPGPTDIAYAEQVYAQPNGHRHTRKHR